MGYVVRRAVERDIPQVAELCVQLAEHESRIIGKPIDTDEVYNRVSHEILHSNDCAYFVAEADNGCIVSVLKVADKGGGEFRLSEAFTKPSWRRRGAMTALFNAALSWAVERGANTVFLTIVRGNDAALNFWKGLGFEFDRFAGDDLLRMKRRADRVTAL